MSSSATHAAAGWRYGLLGLPLAFATLPLYVILPNHYARAYGVPLGALGAALLAVRLFDAVADPWIGRISDRLFACSTRDVLSWAGLAAATLGLGFAALFHPPMRGTGSLLTWVVTTLAISSLAFSALSISHQSWGAMLGGDEAQRARIVAVREAFGLIGVLIASVLPLVAGLTVTAGVFAMVLTAGWWAWTKAPRPQALPGAQRTGDWCLPLLSPTFRRLLAILILNGIGSAIAATLVLFFVQDRLVAGPTLSPWFLAAYFLCAAVAIPGWLALVERIGLARTWHVGMLLAVLAFAGAGFLGQGDGAWYLLVCMASGAALGTDLALPGALLAGEIARAGHRGRAEGAYFGWWNFAGKLNLALAAGTVLPALAFAGYAPGTRTVAGLQALTVAYCVLPCVFKLAAAWLLHATLIRPRRTP